MVYFFASLCIIFSFNNSFYFSIKIAFSVFIQNITTKQKEQFTSKNIQQLSYYSVL